MLIMTPKFDETTVLAPTMDIHSKNGAKVIFTDTNGYDTDCEYAKNAGFIKGKVYTVKKTNISSYSTSVSFHEIEGWFNSVMFITAED